MRNWIFRCLICALSVCLLGCGDAAKYESAGAPDPPETTASEEAPAPQETPDPEPPEMERVKAGVGVGIKGRSLDGYTEGVEATIASPAQAYFSAKEKITFEIQLQHAMNLYKATHGRLPKTHESFMNDIVKFNQIKLPELPPGHKYLFDPEKGQLMVERPKG